MLRALRILALLVLATALPALADTTWVAAGDVSGQWNASGSPYMIQGHVSVIAGDTLRIGPGVIVYFTGPYRMTVSGLLLALGDVGDSIRFTTDTLLQPNRWRGLRLLYADSSSRLEYCVIENGWAATGGDDRYGGGLECRASSPTLRSCSIRHNLALLDGGGIYCRDGANPRMERCEITYNRTTIGGGGALMGRSSSPVLTDCVIRGNRAAENGGGLDFLVSVRPMITGCTLENNRAVLGGAVYASGTAALIEVVGSVVSSNVATQIGGGIYVASGTLKAHQTLFSYNEAADGGGAAVAGLTGELINCIFFGNNASGSGGGVRCTNNTSVLIRHCTLWGNAAASGGGVAVSSAQPVLHNSIIAASPSGAGVHFTTSPSATVSFCCLWDNNDGAYTGDVPGSLGITDTTNLNGDSCDHAQNLYADPRPLDPSSEDFHLNDVSRCIAAGQGSDVEEDYDGSPRPRPARTPPDIGALENPLGRGYLYVCGTLRGFVGPGDVWVACDISVEANDTLTVQAGTRFLFRGRYSLEVRGRLLAVGTPADSIVFARYDEADTIGWKGIRFFSGSTGCLLRYCVMEGVHGDGYARPGGCGGIYCSGASPWIEYSSIRENQASFRGGGIACYDDARPQIRYCTISDNAVTGSLFHYGGGVYSQNSNPLLVGCDIRSNSAMTRGGGVYSDNSEMSLTDCLIHGNASPGLGGGAYCEGTGPTFISCQFYENNAHEGGAVYLHSYSRLEGCIVRDNTATDGAGIFSNWYGASLYRCVVYDNVAQGSGGGMRCVTSGPALENCTIAANAAPLGAGISIANAAPILNSTVIAFSAGDGLHFDHSDQSEVCYCDVFGNTTDLAFASGNPSHGPAGLGTLATVNVNGDSCDAYFNIFLDPQFVDFVERDFHIQATSPCVHAGDPALPHDPDSTVADIGAFSITSPYHLPDPFDLLRPGDGDTVTMITEFCWQSAHDSDPGDVVSYELHFVTEDTMFFYSVGVDTCLTTDLDTLPVPDSVHVAWFVYAHCLYPDSGRRSESMRIVFVVPPHYPPSPFDLLQPADGDTLTGEAEFCWQRARDPDSTDVVTYELVFFAPDSMVSLPAGFDTCHIVDVAMLPFGDSTVVQWFVRARSRQPDTTISSLSTWQFFIPPLAADIRSGELPTAFALHANYPNPFNPLTTISFDVPRVEHVIVQVFDLLGREVTTLHDSPTAPGRYQLSFDGSRLSSGVYIYRMVSPSFTASQKMVLLK